MRRMIDVAPDASATDCDCTRRRIDSRVFDRGEIDYQTIIANSQTACVVTAAADGDKQIVISGEVHRADYICDIRAPRDQAWFLMDHRVVDLTRVVVICVSRLDQSAS